ncbi:MAG: flagellar basal-body MS-ring/collar protein FliF [Xanthomonadales bacterium]|nr:flagellar basal-body MS-ring/collar protein FliF [Xanthomonadales bacterium]
MATTSTDLIQSTPQAAESAGLVSAFKGFDRLPAARQFGLLVALAGAIAIAVAAGMWSQSPDYTMLYGRMSDTEAMEVIDALNRHQIKHRVDVHSGTIMVPQDQVHSARLQLAGDGLPRGNSQAMGYEILDQQSGFTTTQRAEDSRHQRALEGELAKSISLLSLVRSARVHMALARPSAFLRENRQSSASVIVHLAQGKKLSDNDVSGIVHLVASSVADLEPERVTVVDQNGRLLTQRGNVDDLGFDESRFEFTRRIEQSYVDRILDIVTPVVGHDGVRAQVVASVDFTQSESTEEIWEPDDTAIRSEIVDEENSVQESAGGVPGALTNQPPPAGTVEPEAGTEAQAQPVRSSRELRRNYELDRRVSHTRLAPGQVTRISVAVVIDHLRSVDEEGNMQLTPRTEEEIAHVRSLVEKTVGYTPERGDSVEVVNTAFFTPPPAPEVAEPPIWEQPWLWQIAKQVVAPLALIVMLMMILKPTFRNLSTHPGVAAVGGQAAGGAMALPPGSVNEADLIPVPPDEAEIKQAMSSTRQLVADDPARAAQVVREWMADDS